MILIRNNFPHRITKKLLFNYVSKKRRCNHEVFVCKLFSSIKKEENLSNSESWFDKYEEFFNQIQTHGADSLEEKYRVLKSSKSRGDVDRVYHKILNLFKMKAIFYVC